MSTTSRWAVSLACELHVVHVIATFLCMNNETVLLENNGNNTTYSANMQTNNVYYLPILIHHVGITLYLNIPPMIILYVRVRAADRE